MLAELRACAGGDRGARGRARAAVYAAGSHPLASGHDQELVPLPRYEQMAKSVGAGDLAAARLRAARPRLGRRPVCASSRRSCRGCRSCLRSRRTRPFSSARTRGCARHGQRRCSPCRRAGRRRSSRRGTTGSGTGGDSTRRHWDAWPRPEYGTLEVRVMDMQTDVRRARRLRGDRAAPGRPSL